MRFLIFFPYRMKIFIYFKIITKQSLIFYVFKIYLYFFIRVSIKIKKRESIQTKPKKKKLIPIITKRKNK